MSLELMRRMKALEEKVERLAQTLADTQEMLNATLPVDLPSLPPLYANTSALTEPRRRKRS